MRHAPLFALAVFGCVSTGLTPAIAQQAPYVVVVDYTTDAASFEALRTLILGVAQASITEPGCRRFDVVAPADRPDHLTLYEVFDSKAAFEAHAATPHFKRFVTESGALHATRTATPGGMVVSLHNP